MCMCYAELALNLRNKFTKLAKWQQRGLFRGRKKSVKLRSIFVESNVCITLMLQDERRLAIRMLKMLLIISHNAKTGFCWRTLRWHYSISSFAIQHWVFWSDVYVVSIRLISLLMVSSKCLQYLKIFRSCYFNRANKYPSSPVFTESHLHFEYCQCIVWPTTQHFTWHLFLSILCFITSLN